MATRESKAEKLLLVLMRRKEKGVNSIEAMRWAGSRAAARKHELRKKGYVIHETPEKFNGISSVRWTLQLKEMGLRRI